jgi:hypothetical protein
MKRATFAFVACVGCHDGREPAAVPASVAPAPEAGAPVTSGFATATGRDGLFPGMTADAARVALTTAGFPLGEHTGNAKPPHWLTTEIRGWTGTLYLDDADRIVRAILYMSPTVASESEAEALASQAAAPYDAPMETRHVEGKDGTFAETHRLWRNGEVELEITVHEHRSGGVRWFVTEEWSRRDRG